MKQTQTPVREKTVIPEQKDDRKITVDDSKSRLSRVTQNISFFIFLLSATAAFVGLYLNNCTGRPEHTDRSSLDTTVLIPDSNIVAHVKHVH